MHDNPSWMHRPAAETPRGTYEISSQLPRLLFHSGIHYSLATRRRELLDLTPLFLSFSSFPLFLFSFSFSFSFSFFQFFFFFVLFFCNLRYYTPHSTTWKLNFLKSKSRQEWADRKAGCRTTSWLSSIGIPSICSNRPCPVLSTV